MNAYLTQKVRSVEPLGAYRLRVTFEDGFSAEADLGPLLEAGPIFAPWHDVKYFRDSVRVICGVPEWGDDLDLSPASLRAWCEAGRFMDYEETDRWIAQRCGRPVHPRETGHAEHLPEVVT